MLGGNFSSAEQCCHSLFPLSCRHKHRVLQRNPWPGSMVPVLSTPEQQWANSKSPGWEVLGKNVPTQQSSCTTWTRPQCCCFLCSVTIFNGPWKSLRQQRATHRNEGQKAFQKHPSEAGILELTLLTEGWVHSSNLRWAFFRQVVLKLSEQCQFQRTLSRRKPLFTSADDSWDSHTDYDTQIQGHRYSCQPFFLNGNLICDSADQCRCLIINLKKNYSLTSSITEP